MGIEITSVKITGNPDGAGWSQVHDFTPTDSEKFSKRGRVIAVISNNNHLSGIDEVILGREMISRFHEEYFSEASKKPYNALQDAVTNSIAEFKKIYNLDVEIAALSYVSEFIYISCGGGAGVSLFRNGSFVKLLTSIDNKINTASGTPKLGDIMILGTSKFFKIFPEGVISAAASPGNISQLAEVLTPKVYSNDNTGDLGCAFIDFKMSSQTPIIVDKIDAQPTKIIDELKSRKVVIGNHLSKMKSLWPSRVYIGSNYESVEDIKKKKTIQSVGVILTGLLILSIIFGIIQKNRQDGRREFDELINKATHDYEEAVQIFSLDPERARELILRSEESVQKIDPGINEAKLDELKKGLAENKGKILGEYMVDPLLYLDLGVSAENFVGEEAVASIDNMIILDRNSKRVMRVGLSVKSSEVVAGSNQVNNVSDISFYDDRIFVLNDDGVYEIGNEYRKISENVWSDNSSIFAYAANIYVLDRTVSDIFRISSLSSGANTSNSWLSGDTKINLSGMVDWTIDGFIWVLMNDGSLYKLSQGIVSGVYEINQGERIFTSENSEYLYILNKSEGRVYVYDKAPKYIAYYASDKLKNAKDIAIHEADKRAVFLADDGNLYSFNLNHLNN